MKFGDFNLNHLRVFESVFRYQSMTEASRRLNLTQSGVSQHILALEQELNIRLFDRLSQKLIPTEQGKILHRACQRSFDELDNALVEITGLKKRLRGKVRIGLPVEFGNNMILPLLGKFQKQHPEVEFKLDLGFGYEMLNLLLSGEMGFAFVDDVVSDRRLRLKKVYDETLSLCIARGGALDGALRGRADFASLPCVCYQPDAPMIKKWLKHHYGIKKASLKINAVVMDVMGISKLIREDIGAGILPHHFMKTHPAVMKKLRIVETDQDKLHNSINLAFLPTREPSELNSVLMDYICEKLTE